MSTLKIYGAKAVRDVLKGVIRNNRPEWLAEEIGIKYERISLNPQAGETKNADYLKIHPFGKVPAIQDGDFTLFESAATCLYLAEKHKKFIPLPGTPDYYTCLQWCFFAVSNIEPNALRIFGADHFMEKGEFATGTRKIGIERLVQFFPKLEEIFGKQASLMSSGFNVADILLTTALLYVPTEEVCANYPNIRVYLKRMCERPAYQKAIALNGT